jgi:hypothetical protein
MGPHAPITDTVFAAYLRCETKAFLLLNAAASTDPEIQCWQQGIAKSYKADALRHLCNDVPENEACHGNAVAPGIPGTTLPIGSRP